MPDRQSVADSVWTTIVNAYHQGGRTRVELPFEDVIDVLAALAANLLSQIPDAGTRDRIIRDLGPKVARMESAARSRSNVHLPSRPKLIV